MRLVIIRSLAVLTAGAAVLIAVLYVASTVDARAPVVLGFELTQSLPDDPETALITTSLEVEFNESVQVDARTVPLTLEPDVEGTVSWSGSTMTFTPRDRLELVTTYLATVGMGIRDLAGNRIATPPPAFTFSTAGRPSVARTLPEHGATDVPIDQRLQITFSTLMDTGSVERELTIEPALPHELRWSGELLEIVPTAALDAGREYVIHIGAGAADVAGVALEGRVSISFHTVAAGLSPLGVLPADGVDGIAPTAPIAVIFDRPIDPDSVDADLISITPEVAGSLDVVSPAGVPVDDSDPSAGTILRFTPSGQLPLNTTFEVTLAPGLRAVDGGLMAEPHTWTFTTGAPAATLSNQITFISDRGGVANVWAMNPDGSGQHEVSTELTAVLDYAISPDGSRIVVADGRRLIAMRADGSGRSVLTDEVHLEFDPAYAPDGQRLVFGRADAETGAGLGLWLVSVDGGEPTQIELPAEVGAAPTPTPSPSASDVEGGGLLRAPRFAPDGQALAFVDLAGRVAILELPAERLTTVEATAVASPAWLPDSSGILLTHGRAMGMALVARDGRVHAMDSFADEPIEVSLMRRSGTALTDTDLGAGALLSVDRGGRLAYLTPDGRLHVSDGPDDRGEAVPATDGERILGAHFATGEDSMVIVVAPRGEDDATSGSLELLDLETGERTVLAPEGSRPHWLP
ncbi:MAG: Ig-like domain-containing protein [Candidatus Limnocylindria bacterium]